MSDLETRLREQLRTLGHQAPPASALRSADAPRVTAESREAADRRRRWGVPVALASGVAAVTVTMAVLTGAPPPDAPQPAPAESAQVPPPSNGPSADAQYPRNDSGESYGGLKENDSAPEPDLIAVVAENGRSGYVRKRELYPSPPANPREAAEQQRRRDARAARGETVDRYIPVYDRDGKTQIGVFPLSLGP